MVAVIVLACVALLLCILLIVGGTVRSRPPAPQLKHGEARPKGPRATGLN
jgi:hypothetical protein